jgi:hypothetical protein
VYSGIELARALDAVPGRGAAGVPVGVPFGVPVGVPIYSVATYDQGLPFYWQRTVTLVAYRGELDFGLRHSATPLATVPEFLARWQDLPEAYAVMEISMFEELEGRGVPMREMAHDVHRVLVARR